MNVPVLLAPTKDLQRPGSTPTLRSRAPSSTVRPPFPVLYDPTGTQSNPPSLSPTQSVQSVDQSIPSGSLRSVHPSIQSVDQSTQSGSLRSSIQSVDQSTQSGSLRSVHPSIPSVDQSIQPAHLSISSIIPTRTLPLPNHQADFLARIVGGGDTGLNNALARVFLLLNLGKLAPGLAKIDKGRNFQTVQRYIDHLSVKYPSLYDDIRIISGLTGKTCRDQVCLVHAALLGQDSDTPNSVVFAIILGVISHPESPKKQFIESATQDFVICPEHDRSELLQASEQGHLLHLPLPLGVAVDLRSLPGYISLNPVDNPDGFESTWLDYFVFIVNLLCFEATTSQNIGELESKLHQFQLSSDSFSSHPFHQKQGETTTQWAARISHAHRDVIAACAKAQCPSRSPCASQLVSLVYACVLPTIWAIADLIMSERNFHPQTFQEAISLMLDAERRVHHQDPKVTLTRRLRAHQPGPTAPLTPSTPPSAVPSTIPATTPTKKPPPIDETELDQHPDVKWLRKIFDAEPPSCGFG